MSKPSKENKGFFVFFDWVDDLNYLGGEKAWEMITAICNYYRDGENPVDNVEQPLKPMASLMFHQIKRGESISAVREEAGRKGGFATAKNSKAEAEPKQNAPTYTNTNTNTNTNTIINNPPIPPKGAEVYAERFCIFWDAFPKKVGKTAAEKAFKKIQPSAELLQKMLEAIKAQKQSEQWARDGGQFIPHPATWLNRGQWDDEITAPQNQKADISLDEFFS